jgi:hypothetical protein
MGSVAAYSKGVVRPARKARQGFNTAPVDIPLV